MMNEQKTFHTRCTKGVQFCVEKQNIINIIVVGIIQSQVTDDCSFITK